MLELGCAAGGNLLPFALSYPNASAVGVDLSPAQVAAGQKVIDELKVNNLTLHAMDLTKIDKDFGTFDYIIVHGVFSWVPPEVKQAILRICHDNLSPQGIAYISYNTYPGWKAGDIVRDAMLLHSHSAKNDEERLASARTMLTLLSEGLAASNPLAASLKASVAQLRKYSDYYIAHEHLETFNTPCYFVEFANAAQQAGLAYIGDAEAQSELSDTYGQNVQLNHSLVAMGQPKEMRQQYLDFAVGRTFRKSLLMATPPESGIQSTPSLALLGNLRLAGHFTATGGEPDAHGRSAYRNQRGKTLHTKEPAVIALMNALTGHWPASVALTDLCAETSSEDATEPAASPSDDATLKAAQTLFRLGMVHICREPGPYDTCSENKGPHIIPGFAHLHLQHQQGDTSVGTFNLWHDTINLKLPPASALMLPLLTGSQLEAQLRTQLRDALQAGKVPDTKGKLRTGERNLDAEAQNIMNKLMPVLKQTGVLMP